MSYLSVSVVTNNILKFSVLYVNLKLFSPWRKLSVLHVVPSAILHYLHNVDVDTFVTSSVLLVFTYQYHLQRKFSDCTSLLITLKHTSGLCTGCQICRQQQEQKNAIPAVSSILSDQHTAGLSSCVVSQAASTNGVFGSEMGPSINRDPSFERGFWRWRGPSQERDIWM